MKDGKIKTILLQIFDKYYRQKKAWFLKRHYSLNIMSPEETIAYIKNNNCSVARLGDGEFSIMMQSGAPTFEKGSPEMGEQMKKVFAHQSSDLLICLPSILSSKKLMDYRDISFWKNWALYNQQNVVEEIRKLISEEYVFGCAEISRPYSTCKRIEDAKKTFDSLKELWENKNILIVEGAQTRMGVGNDLLTNSKSIKRILIPPEDAFSKYNKILTSVLKNYNNELILLAAGPTATILASDLAYNNIQAIDIGHLDIQYEWSKTKKMYEIVPGKYTNEVCGGNQVADCFDELYISQIIDRII